MEPIIAVSIFYPLGVLYSYFAHKRFSFQNSDKKNWQSIIKYITIYVMGYFLNIGLIYIFYNILDYPHQIVQLIAIFIVAGFLFTALKFIVFKNNN